VSAPQINASRLAVSRLGRVANQRTACCLHGARQPGVQGLAAIKGVGS